MQWTAHYFPEGRSRSNTINVQIEIKHSLNSPCWEQVNCFKFNVNIFVVDGLLFGWIYRRLHWRGWRSRKFFLTCDCSFTIWLVNAVIWLIKRCHGGGGGCLVWVSRPLMSLSFCACWDNGPGFWDISGHRTLGHYRKLADISKHGTLADIDLDISGHGSLLEINRHFRKLNFQTLVVNMSRHWRIWPCIEFWNTYWNKFTKVSMRAECYNLRKETESFDCLSFINILWNSNGINQ